jgi:hypothetical protein
MASKVSTMFEYDPVAVAGTLLNASDLGGVARQDAEPEPEAKPERRLLAFLLRRGRRYPTAASPRRDFTSA